MHAIELIIEASLNQKQYFEIDLVIHKDSTLPKNSNRKQYKSLTN